MVGLAQMQCLLPSASEILLKSSHLLPPLSLAYAGCTNTFLFQEKESERLNKPRGAPARFPGPEAVLLILLGFLRLYYRVPLQTSSLEAANIPP